MLIVLNSSGNALPIYDTNKPKYLEKLVAAIELWFPEQISFHYDNGDVMFHIHMHEADLALEKLDGYSDPDIRATILDIIVVFYAAHIYRHISKGKGMGSTMYKYLLNNSVITNRIADRVGDAFKEAVIHANKYRSDDNISSSDRG